ncbi:MAG TPA: hypothetical protein VIL42_02920 [Sphingomicrobium sp.]|jgi:hypothetical protein
MIIMIASVALAAAAPQAAPAPAPQPQGHMQHMQHKPVDGKGEQKKMDCCACCKDMAKHEAGHDEHAEHGAH